MRGAAGNNNLYILRPADMSPSIYRQCGLTAQSVLLLLLLLVQSDIFAVYRGRFWKKKENKILKKEIEGSALVH